MECTEISKYTWSTRHNFNIHINGLLEGEGSQNRVEVTLELIAENFLKLMKGDMLYRIKKCCETHANNNKKNKTKQRQKNVYIPNSSQKKKSVTFKVIINEFSREMKAEK